MVSRFAENMLAQTIWQIVFSAITSGLVTAAFWQQASAPPVAVGLVFFALAIVVFAVLHFAKKGDHPVGAGAGTSGPNSPAANVGAGALIQNLGSGTINVNLPPRPKSADEAKRLAQQEQTEAARIPAELAKEAAPPGVGGAVAQPSDDEQAVNDRFAWLAGLASLRNVGVTRRNELAGLTGDNAEINAEAKYVAWLQFALKHIRTLPVHGRHEAHAFETLDRFRLDAAPVGNYATPRIALISAMFSTHLERIEEMRKRYTMTWPV